MLVRPAEERFQKGMSALTAGRRREALALFEAAIELDMRLGAQRPQARYLSQYGLCLAHETNKLAEAIRLCREATTFEFYNPELCLNLGRVLLLADRRKEAYEILRQGQRLERGHAGITRELKNMGRRRRPFVPFLSRRNPINVLLGRMTRGSGGTGPLRTGAIVSVP